MMANKTEMISKLNDIPMEALETLREIRNQDKIVEHIMAETEKLK